MAFHMLANPAVIIGLGGTGKWVLTYLKKNLLDTYGGQLPRTIKLLSFDTTEEKVSYDGKPQEEEARVGEVQLDRTEFVYLGGNIHQICREIRDKNSHKHIGSWLQAATYLETVDPDAFDIGKGAGQKRPFGRMAVFYSLQAQVQSQLANRIKTALTEVFAASERDAAVEIFIVASLAGGTGAGMFIDVAHLTRWFAHKIIRTSFAIRGFLALQNTFRQVLNVNQIEANTGAALRELDRFMLVFDQHYPIVYNPEDPLLKTIYGGQTGKLFDNCYILDAVRDRFSLDDVHPKYGVYPSIADSISMLLDVSAGDAYAQHYKNVNTRIAEIQSRTGRPTYSSLGTYSLILPVEDIITSLTYRFALELIDQYLVQFLKQKDENQQETLVLTYEDDPRKRVLEFLRAASSESGLNTTQFLLNVPNLVERNLNEISYLREFAETDSSALLVWLLPPQSDPVVAKIAHDVREILQIQLINRVQPSNIEGDDFINGCDRILNGVAHFKDEFLGRDINGRRIGGRYRLALEQCVAIQRERYCLLLHEYILRALNGSAPTNPAFQQERQGKLGFVHDFLLHLSQAFEKTQAFFEKVRIYRSQTDDLRRRRETVGQTHSLMEEAKTRGSFLGMFVKGIHPAVKAQQSYLEAEQDLIGYETNELLLENLRMTAETLCRATNEVKGAVDAWLNTLLRGYRGSFNDAGAYENLQSQLAQHRANRAEKQNIKVHEYLTDAIFEDSLYQKYAQGKHDDALAHLVWQIERDSSIFQLTLPNLGLAAPETIQGRRATEQNSSVFFQLARNYFEPIRRLTIAERLSKAFNPSSLALKFAEKCSPMIRFDAQKQGSQEENRFVCVSEGQEQAFFTEFAHVFRTMGSQAKDNQILPAANPYTCTVLATADVISSSGILAYIAAEEAYYSYQGDARMLHIFPAEVHAVELEALLPTIRRPRQKFAPRLTAMLEDRQRVELFLLCYLYRFIHFEQAGRNNCFVLQLRTQNSRRSIGRFVLTPAERNPSLFTAMETFIFKGADIESSETRINFELLEQDLRAYEAQVMGGKLLVDPKKSQISIEGGDYSCLINFLEQSLDDEIAQLLASNKPIEQDLGCLLALTVNSLIESLQKRLSAQGLLYNRLAQPQFKLSREPGTLVGNPALICMNGHQMPLGAKFCSECAAPAQRITTGAGLVCLNGHQISLGTKFCSECGAPPRTLATITEAFCPNGHQMPLGAKFCPECGATVNRSFDGRALGTLS